MFLRISTVSRLHLEMYNVLGNRGLYTEISVFDNDRMLIIKREDL